MSEFMTQLHDYYLYRSANVEHQNGRSHRDMKIEIIKQ